MERRQFIGATAAVLASAVMPRSAAAGNSPAMPIDLNWRSEVIKTIPNNPSDRQPVVTDVSMKRDGKEMAIVGDDHHIGIFDMASQSFTHHIDAHRDWVRSAVYAPQGNQLASAGNDRALKVWASGNYKAPLFTRNHDDAIIKLAYSPDGTKLATVGFEKTMRIYDAQTGRVTQQMDCACPDNHAVAFSVDGDMIAAAGRCGTVCVWEANTGKVVSRAKVHRQRVRSLQFTSGGQIVSTSDDRMVKIIDPKTGVVDNALPRQASKLFAAQLMGDDMLATGGSDNKIRIWKLDSLQEVGVLHGHTGTISCLEAGDGILISGSFDTQVRVWQVSGVSTEPFERRADQKWRALK